ncbi:MAG: hypothetical protein JW860_00375 [Sedimentisphaerales bacterium]|nr:hypothetical protein [Sedimentisphaerales bacterium]
MKKNIVQRNTSTPEPSDLISPARNGDKNSLFLILSFYRHRFAQKAEALQKLEYNIVGIVKK